MHARKRLEHGEVLPELLDELVGVSVVGVGLDGLLGMNVLRNYRFEIDQDNEILYMSPRL